MNFVYLQIIFWLQSKTRIWPLDQTDQPEESSEWVIGFLGKVFGAGKKELKSFRLLKPE